MLSLQKGRYIARMASGSQDIRDSQILRYRCFHAAAQGRGALLTQNDRFAQSVDEDPYDAICEHILVEDQKTKDLVCSFRLFPLQTGADVARSYSAQHYDLSDLSGFVGTMLEIGRFCIDPAHVDPDILRIAWGALTKYVDENQVDMMFGCTSFQGVDPVLYQDAFGLLRDKYLAPKRFMPRIKAAEVFDFEGDLHSVPDLKAAMQQMPPLLRTYLTMGGWVSDHAVIDRDLGTLHVFTGIEVGAIPPARAKLLRMSAA